MNSRRCGTRILALSFLLIFAVTLWAQSPSGSSRGQVTDPSGAMVPDATVTATPATGAAVSATTTRQGAYEIKALAPGNYTVTVEKDGRQATDSVEIRNGAISLLRIVLEH